MHLSIWATPVISCRGHTSDTTSDRSVSALTNHSGLTHHCQTQLQSLSHYLFVACHCAHCCLHGIYLHLWSHSHFSAFSLASILSSHTQDHRLIVWCPASSALLILCKLQVAATGTMPITRLRLLSTPLSSKSSSSCLCSFWIWRRRAAFPALQVLGKLQIATTWTIPVSRLLGEFRRHGNFHCCRAACWIWVRSTAFSTFGIPCKLDVPT
mmetsp:Transcript_72014/g.114174  ORF Transcript_72014/g.114174 Transcript_72014/m.114174 type:complete len:211 (+) Transcript_72014:311-943(+)